MINYDGKVFTVEEFEKCIKQLSRFLVKATEFGFIEHLIEPEVLHIHPDVLLQLVDHDYKVTVDDDWSHEYTHASITLCNGYTVFALLSPVNYRELLLKLKIN